MMRPNLTQRVSQDRRRRAICESYYEVSLPRPKPNQGTVRKEKLQTKISLFLYFKRLPWKICFPYLKAKINRYIYYSLKGFGTSECEIIL